MKDALARYGLERNAAGELKFAAEMAAKIDCTGFKAVYRDSLVCYLNIFDRAYCRALNRSEFELVSLLIRFHSIEDAGWDPFEDLRRQRSDPCAGPSDWSIRLKLNGPYSCGFTATSWRRPSHTRS